MDYVMLLLLGVLFFPDKLYQEKVVSISLSRSKINMSA